MKTGGAIERLLGLFENGLMDMDGPTFVERVRRHKADRLRHGPIGLRGAYIRMFVSRIIVSRREVHSATLAKAAGEEPPPQPRCIDAQFYSRMASRAQ